MNEKIIVESLSPMERLILPVLDKDFLTTTDISNKINMDKTTIIRAIGLLERKKILERKAVEVKKVGIGILGINYLKKELPERALLNKLDEKKSFPISEIRNICELNENESRVALGILKKKNLIRIENGRIKLAEGNGIGKKMTEELFMEKLPIDLNKLGDLDKIALENLKQRKDIIEIIDKKIISARLTEFGRSISKMDMGTEMIETLTPKMLKRGGWKGKKFRRYDLNAPISRIYGGKRHFVNQSTDYAKSIWLEMGFKEMKGNMVESGFWVFDSLFTAQDHPAREMQDTFYVKNLRVKNFYEEENGPANVLSNIRKAHEGGVDGSKGWQYKWDVEESRKVVLRSHTTSLSAKKLMEIGKNQEFPAKYFALGKCFRNETVDWSHGFEFNQTEGIVVDENANFRQLLGYLKQFFSKMGYDKLRIRPGYFAYTEPSLEIDIWHPVHKKWLELGGAGMFRPEVTIPMFGRHIPVLAWGPGFDRIIMEFFGINDLREMYKNDLNKLREMKFWRK